MTVWTWKRKKIRKTKQKIIFFLRNMVITKFYFACFFSSFFLAIEKWKKNQMAMDFVVKCRYYRLWKCFMCVCVCFLSIVSELDPRVFCRKYSGFFYDWNIAPPKNHVRLDFDVLFNNSTCSKLSKFDNDNDWRFFDSIRGGCCCCCFCFIVLWSWWMNSS